MVLEINQKDYSDALNNMTNSACEILNNEVGFSGYWGSRNSSKVYVFFDLTPSNGGRRTSKEDQNKMLIVFAIVVMATAALTLISALFEVQELNEKLNQWKQYSKVLTEENCNEFVCNESNNSKLKFNNSVEPLLESATEVLTARLKEANYNALFSITAIASAGLIITGACMAATGLSTLFVVAGFAGLTAIAIGKIYRAICCGPSNKSLQMMHNKTIYIQTRMNLPEKIYILINDYINFSFRTRCGLLFNRSSYQHRYV
jgi:hypothetical protein